jgi:hypothetical protein
VVTHWTTLLEKKIETNLTREEGKKSYISIFKKKKKEKVKERNSSCRFFGLGSS